MNEKKEQHIQTAIRLPKALLERVDKLAVQLTRPGLSVMRSDVLRMAAFKGIELLEAEGGTKKKR